MLLFEPGDHELGQNTPYFAALTRRTSVPLQWLLTTEHGTVLGHLARLTIKAEDVDHLLIDHLHTQDLRRWIGTTSPSPTSAALCGPPSPSHRAAPRTARRVRPYPGKAFGSAP